MQNKDLKQEGFVLGIRICLSFIGIFSAFFLSFLFNNSAFASDHSISLSTSGDIYMDIQADNSTVQSSEVNVTTTCRAGYNLFLSTSGNDNNLYPNGDSSTTSTYFSPSDGNTALNNATDTWGYSLDISGATPSTNNVFLPVPTVNAVPAPIRTTRETASETSIDDDVSIYYGVNASYNIASGAYHMQNDAGTNNPGKIVYYVTMNPLCAIELDLDFNENLDGVGAEGTDDTVANFPNEYDNTADIINNTLTLTSKIPARNNYIFTGWNTEADGSGTSYQPGAVIRVGDGADELTGNVTLYAIWEVGEAYTVTVNFSEHDVNNVEFHHTNYVTQEVTENGGMAVLRANENYSIIINY